MTRRRLGIAFVLVALSLAAVVPIHFMARTPDGQPRLRPRLPASHDIAMHFDFMRAFSRGLASGRLFPRWQEEANRGFGSPALGFHPPGVYYVTSVVHLPVRDWSWTFLWSHLLLFAGSGAAAYLCLRSLLAPWPSAMGAATYVVAPYHLLDLYPRGAMAELLAFVWMPLAWLYADRLLDGEAGAPRLRRLACLALAYGALWWSHPPTAYPFTLVLVLYAALRAFAEGKLPGLAGVAAGLALGVGLSAAYLYPAAVERDWIRSDHFREVWAYRDGYVFSPAVPAHASASFWRLIEWTWAFGAVGLAATGLALLAGRTEPPRWRNRAVLWVALGTVVALLMTPVTAPLEAVLPGLDMVSFPWRMLSIQALLLAFLTGACAEAAWGTGGRRSMVPAVVAAGVLAGGAAFAVVGVAAPAWRAPGFHARPGRPTADIFWMLPKTALQGAEALPEVPPAVLERGAGTVDVERWDPEARRLVVDLRASDAVRLRTFAFPGWTARLDGRVVALETDPTLGSLVLRLPPGRHAVSLDYEATPARRLGAWASAASLVLVAAALIRGRRAS